MLKISILKVENPSCLWGRVMWGHGRDHETTEQHNKLLAQMNLFYNDITHDQHKLKPKTIEPGQVCVMYWSVKKFWCRAMVESVIVGSCNVRCLLVDHGERLLVPSDQIRVVVEKFLQLPFLVRRFHLARVQPTTLRVSICEEKAELIPSSQWDSSATLYLHSLLRASTQIEAVLLESESESTSIELYLTVGNIKICVNDDLVAKHFAYYSGDSADSRLDEEGSSHLRLSARILRQPLSTALDMLTSRTEPTAVISQVPVGAGGPQTASSTPQLALVNSHEDKRSRFPTQLSPSKTSKHNRDAAVESDSPDDTDSSLAAALSLFRFLRFMNPGSSFHHTGPTVRQSEELSDRRPQEMKAASNGCTAQEGVEPSEIHPPTESGCEEAEKMWGGEENQACSRLMKWLNPGPLNPDLDTANDQVVSEDPRNSEILVHSALPVQPCTGLCDAPVTDALRSVLRRSGYSALSPADRCSWPSVAQGCNTLIISNTAEQPVGYLAPLLTHMLNNSVFNSLTSSTGPMAVLLCPGWEKAQAVYDLLDEYKVSQILHPLLTLLGVGKDEAKTVKIPKNCLLLVTTPCSLVRLLSCHCFMFLRLYHLVLDEADRLFSLAPDQMKTILQHFQKVTLQMDVPSRPHQIVAVAKRWVSEMEGLLTQHMPYPCIVMTVPEEAALYGNVQQIILMTLESSKLSVLLGALDFNPDVGQKTLIVANFVQEVEDVFKAVSNKSAFCLKTHEGLTHQFDFIIQQWRKDIGPGTHVILVTTIDCLKCLGIRDAHCVVHYGFPTSPKQFGHRLFCMIENFRNLSERSCRQSPKSVLLISENKAPHVMGLMRYLGRTQAYLPAELVSFAQGIHAAREDKKTNKPLCCYLKSFGVCRDSGLCPDRHRFIFELDHSQLPASGVIEVVPLFIKTASVFYGRIVSKDDAFASLVSEMTCYYGEKKPFAKEVLEGGLYTVEEGDAFHRVKILSLPDRRGRLFYSAFVRFIDVGKEEEVKSHQILELPQQFQTLPGQAVEMIVCRVKPVDAEIDWHPKATRAISQKIRGLQHRARAVLSLGNTVFVDPMVRVTQVPSIKTVINEHNVLSEILKTGMGVTNPEHLNLLKAFCQETGPISLSGDGLVPLELCTKAEGEVPAEARAADVSRLRAPPLLEPRELLSQVSPNNHVLIPESPAAELHLGPGCAQNSFTSDLKSADQVERLVSAQNLDGFLSQTQVPIEPLLDVASWNRDGTDVCPLTSPTTPVKPCQSGVSAGEDGRTIQQVSDDPPKSFHPRVQWYQTPDRVTVTVKLMSPESQRCDFYADRVVYSGRVDGRLYRAELDLLNSIAADCCSWEMKSNEPVLTLVKQKQSYWENLVRNKSIYVIYDMEHLEEDEDRTSCAGQRFVVDTGEHHCYVHSPSDSDSE